MQDIGNYYVINHVVMFTGLTDRTIRNYISSGILQGEKINGLWHFTPEQVEEFVSHPAVRPSILAKNNGIVYYFLLDDKKKNSEICLILDAPNVEKKLQNTFVIVFVMVSFLKYSFLLMVLWKMHE
ncbi:MAG: helix-turn-helix domain-containing protein [Agathobacter sp.]|nr:helix-turn-helix domain-containing protein [Agathobacter sp.]